MQIPGMNTRMAAKTLRKCGFEFVRNGAHFVMSNGKKTIAIPRSREINSKTMAKILKEAGIDSATFRQASL